MAGAVVNRRKYCILIAIEVTIDAIGVLREERMG